MIGGGGGRIIQLQVKTVLGVEVSRNVPFKDKKSFIKAPGFSYRNSLYWVGNQSRNVFLGKIRILVVSRPFKKLEMSVTGILNISHSEQCT